MNKLINFIKHGNNCNNCKAYYFEKTSYEYDEYNVFCFIKSSNYKKCYLIPPFKNIVLFFKKRKYNYCKNHEYDNVINFYNKSKNENKTIANIIKKHILTTDYNEQLFLCYKHNNTYYPYCTDYIQDKAIFIKEDLNDFYNPPIPLKTKWKNLIKETFSLLYKKTLFKIVPFIFK